jgi:hypothetical protein
VRYAADEIITGLTDGLVTSAPDALLGSSLVAPAQADYWAYDAAGQPIDLTVYYGGATIPDIVNGGTEEQLVRPVPEQSVTYDWLGRAVEHSAGVTGQVAQQQYDAAGRLQHQRSADGTDAELALLAYGYSATTGELVTISDLMRHPSGKPVPVTTLYRSATNSVERVRGPLGRLDEQRFDGLGRPVGAIVAGYMDPTSAMTAAVTGGLHQASVFDLEGNLIATSTGKDLATASGHLGSAGSHAADIAKLEGRQALNDYSGSAPIAIYSPAGQVVQTRHPELDESQTLRSRIDHIPAGFGPPSREAAPASAMR